MIKVLIVDDSALMRKLLKDLFSAAGDFEVLEVARNGADAVEKVHKLQPDVITMDVEMPVMDGLTALARIMKERPTPVVMVSSLTTAGAEATIKALENGAVDFIAKNFDIIPNIDNIAQDIVSKCRTAARVNMKRITGWKRPAAVPPETTTLKASAAAATAGSSDRIIAIGTSTGGPRALQEVMSRLPAGLPCGVLIVQHMLPGFTRSLAERLNSVSPVNVKEAEHDEVIRPGWAYLAPGDRHMYATRGGDGRVRIRLTSEPLIGGHRPAVDPMFESVAEVFGDKVVAALLTGMGNDGAKGLQSIKTAHGRTIAEDKSTAVGFGMPKAAIAMGCVDRVAPIDKVAETIVAMLK
ncbi:MAG: chemotaxis response regulator protein-glutamate methylesterase [Negativicutes bacterium]|nr:chemotaxis response regulator protein-glutamate methylesterase [Negativicutes bacterium]